VRGSLGEQVGGKSFKEGNLQKGEEGDLTEGRNAKKGDLNLKKKGIVRDARSLIILGIVLDCSEKLRNLRMAAPENAPSPERAVEE